MVETSDQSAHREPREPSTNGYDSRPLTAEEYIDLMEARPDLVLRTSDGTGDGTFHVWMDDGELFWRCLNWGFGADPCDESHVRALLDSEDVTTQLLTMAEMEADEE